MKKFLIQAAALVLVIFAALAYATYKIPFLNTGTEISKKTEIRIKNFTINVEIADTNALRQKGLGGRQSLASDSGMLFVFEKSDKHKFWMKGLNFPLDLIWIKNNLVIDLTKNAKPPTKNQKDAELPIYLPVVKVDRVLEVGGGFIDSRGIKIGDKVESSR